MLLDPASIAFAALAEEYRGAGMLDEAIDTCRAGLKRHPSYVSARVTLGRALLGAGRLDDAQAELERVLQTAPENLAAIEALAEIRDRQERARLPPDPALTALESFLTAVEAARRPSEDPSS